MGITPRDPRRGVDLVAAQARAALPGVRLGAARLLPHAAAAQRRQVEDLEAQEPGQPQLLPARRLSCPRRCSTSSALMGWSMPRRAREVHARRSSSRPSRSSAISLGGPVFDLEKLTWLNGRYLRRLSPPEHARPAARAPALATSTCCEVLPLVPRAHRHARGLLRLRALLLRRRGGLRRRRRSARMVPKGPHAGRGRQGARRPCSRSSSTRCSTGRTAALEAALRALRRGAAAGRPRTSS